MLATKQKGAALILALFIVGLVAAMAITMMERLSRDIRRTDLLLTHIQAELYAEGSLYFALDHLRTHWLNPKNDEALDEKPLFSVTNQVQGYTISGSIYHATAYFNQNKVKEESWSKPFQKFLRTLNPTLSTKLNNQCFMIETQVDHGEQHLRLYSLVERKMKNLKPFFTLLWQSTGNGG